jgi:uncharacterized protein YdaU (DUF1376 family)
MNESPAFQFYPADYLGDENVLLMTPRQRGAYWHLCCISWRSTPIARLKNDPYRLARLSGLTDDQWKEDGQAILRCFSIDEDGYITQKRLMKELIKQRERKIQTAEAGAASAKKRGQTPKSQRRSTNEQIALNAGVERPDASALNAQNNGVEPLSISSLGLSKTITAEDIYSFYPLQVGKPGGVKAIRRAMEKYTGDKLKALTIAFSKVRFTQNPNFTPRAQKFFDEERFNDAPETWKDTSSRALNVAPNHDKGF